ISPQDAVCNFRAVCAIRLDETGYCAAAAYRRVAGESYINENGAVCTLYGNIKHSAAAEAGGPRRVTCKADIGEYGGARATRLGATGYCAAAGRRRVAGESYISENGIVRAAVCCVA